MSSYKLDCMNVHVGTSGCLRRAESLCVMQRQWVDGGIGIEMQDVAAAI